MRSCGATSEDLQPCRPCPSGLRPSAFLCVLLAEFHLDSDTFGSFPAQIEDSFRDNIGECTKCSCTGSHLQNFSYLSRLLSSTIRDWRVVQQKVVGLLNLVRYHENLWDITDITNKIHKIIYHQHLHSSTIRRIIYLQHSQLASASFARLLEHLESCNVKGYLIRYVARNPFLEVKFTPRHQESPRDQVVWTFLYNFIPELLKKVNKIIVHIFTFRSSTSSISCTHWECSDEGHHDEEIDVDICDDRLRRKSRLGAERSNNLSTKSSTGGKRLGQQNVDECWIRNG